MDKKQRPYIGMHFECCNAYTRIYLNHDGTAFSGHCPKCARSVSIKVSDRGSKSKFWSSE